MPTRFGIVFDTKVKIFQDALNDEKVVGFLFRKGTQSHQFGIWKLSFELPSPFVGRLDKDKNDKELIPYEYIYHETGDILGSLKTPPHTHPKKTHPHPHPNLTDHILEFFEDSLDFVLFGRKKMQYLLNFSSDKLLTISGAKVNYGIGKHYHSKNDDTLDYPTFKAEISSSSNSKIYWKIEVGLPCPTLWEGKDINKLGRLLIGTIQLNLPIHNNLPPLNDLTKTISDELKKLK